MSSDEDYCHDGGDSETKDEYEYEYEDSDGRTGSDDERHDVISLPAPVPLRREASHDFDVLNGEGLKKSMEDDISKAVETFGLPFSVAGSVLRAYQWNFSRMAEAFTDSPETALRLARCDESLLRGSSSLTPSVAHPPSGTLACSICLDSDVPGWKFTALSCGHAFCNDCWLNHINSRLDEGQALGIRCMNATCWNVIDESVIVAICPTETVKEWRRFLVNSFADENPNVRWCPRPGCAMAVRSKFGVGKGSCVPAKCICDTEFCFSCGNEVHVPIPCGRYKDWQVKIDEDAASMNWILQNTKDCPKCHVPIEKNMGCNHMTCRKCRHQFCWLCLSKWEGHVACNGFSSVPEDDRSAMHKYFHYLTRYQAHAHSQALDSELRNRAEVIMSVISARAREANSASSSVLAITSTEDVQFVDKCTEALIECRKALKWTYVAAFYMAEGPEKQMFEYRQSALEAETEALSAALSQEPKVVFASRKKIQAITQTALKRLTALLDGFELGFSA